MWLEIAERLKSEPSPLLQLWPIKKTAPTLARRGGLAGEMHRTSDL